MADVVRLLYLEGILCIAQHPHGSCMCVVWQTSYEAAVVAERTSFEKQIELQASAMGTVLHVCVRI